MCSPFFYGGSMEEKDKVNLDASSQDGKKKRGKTILEQMREIDEKEAEKEAQRLEKQREIAAEQEKQEKEAYEKQIQREKVELIRQKQGITSENDTIKELKEEKVKMSFGKRIYNFFYHNIWWLGITAVVVGIFTFLIVDYVTKDRADLIVMVLTDDDEMQLHSEELQDYLEQFVDDENGDDKIVVDLYYIPVTDTIAEDDYYTGDATKLSTEMLMADSVLLLTDTKANAYINGDETLEDMTELYPEDSNARLQGYYLRHTDFAEKIDYPDNVDRDLSFALRTPTETYDSLEEMQETYDVAKKVLDRIVEDLAGTQLPEDYTGKAYQTEYEETETE